MSISNEEILRIIDNKKYEWQGSINGDDYRKFQARQSEKISYLLILVNRVLLSESPILTKEQMNHILDKHLRELGNFDSNHSARTNNNFSFKNIRTDWVDIIYHMN